MRYAIALIASLMVAVSGCGGGNASAPTINGNGTDAEFKASIDAVTNSLSAVEQAEFAKAVADLLLYHTFSGEKGLLGGSVDEARTKLHGLTGAEVIAKAANLDEQRDSDQIKRAKNSLEEYLAPLSLGISPDNAPIRVDESRLRASGYGVAFAVTNTGNESISSFNLHGMTVSPNRPVPWHSDAFGFRVSGGLEPGETRWFEADWNAPDSDEFVFVARPILANGSEGEKIWEAAYLRDFTLSIVQSRMDDLPESERQPFSSQLADYNNQLRKWRDAEIARQLALERDYLIGLRSTVSAIRIAEARFIEDDRSFRENEIVIDLDNGSNLALTRLKGRIVATHSDTGQELFADGFYGFFDDPVQPGSGHSFEAKREGFLSPWFVPVEFGKVPASKVALNVTIESVSIGEEGKREEFAWTAEHEQRLKSVEAMLSSLGG